MFGLLIAVLLAGEPPTIAFPLTEAQQRARDEGLAEQAAQQRAADQRRQAAGLQRRTEEQQRRVANEALAAAAPGIRDSWAHCVMAVGETFALRPEDPQTLAIGALGACRAEQARMREAFLVAIHAGDFGEAADGAVSSLRERLREEVVAMILTRRAAATRR